MRFQMRNCSKYIPQCKNGNLKKKHFGQQGYPNKYYGSPLTIMHTLWYGESPKLKYTTCAHLSPSEFKIGS